MSSYWKKEYDKILKDLPKNSWVPWIHGKIGDKNVEISVVHTSFPHGLLSCGWAGVNQKYIFYSSPRDVDTRKEHRVKIHTLVYEQAKKIANALNKE